MTYQGITDAWKREKVARLTWIRLNLLAQVAYMRFNQASISIITEPPDVRNNLAGCTYIIRIDGQQMQEFTFCRCHAGLSPINDDFVMERIDTNRTNGDDGGGPLCKGRTPSSAQGMYTR